MRSIVSTECKTAWRCVNCFCRTNLAFVVFDIRCLAQSPVVLDWQYGNRTSKVIRREQELSARMNAHVRRSIAARRNRVEQFQLPALRIYRKRTDRSFLSSADSIRFVRRVESRTRSVRHQATRTRPHFMNVRRSKRPGFAVHVKTMNSASVTRRQIDLRRQNITQW